LPRFFRARLWGDRDRWGLVPDLADHSWIEWQKTQATAYISTQREGIGIRVNDAGYNVVGQLDFTGKVVLEVGPGDIRHLKYLKGKPAKYLLADVSSDMMQFARTRLEGKDIPLQCLLLERNQPLPIADQSVDVIVSFYSLEHLYPLGSYLDDMCRVLKPGGTLIGAIPAEGGLAWGIGRLLTTRRWFKKHTTIELDKIICWEHPNFADQIIAELGRRLQCSQISCWPFRRLPMLDLNLIIRFVYIKPMS
jgi:SAM-dependent methyltransferase